MFARLEWLATTERVAPETAAYRFVKLTNDAELVKHLVDEFGRAEMGSFATLEFDTYLNTLPNQLYSFFDETATSDDPLTELMKMAYDDFVGEIVLFTTSLWLLRDHSLKVGPMYAIGRNNKQTLTKIFLHIEETHAAAGEKVISSLSQDDLQLLKKGWRSHLLNYDRKAPSSRDWGIVRPLHIVYLLHEARSRHNLHAKVAAYVTLLESLLTRDSGELRHRLAERVAMLLGSDPNDRHYIYSQTQKAYDIRSSYVHGQKLTSDKARDSAVFCDSMIRKLLHVNDQGDFSFPQLTDAKISTEEFNRYFLDRMLGSLHPNNVA